LQNNHDTNAPGFRSSSSIDVLWSRGEHADVGELGLSRLDSFIRRLEAQRACLDQAAAAILDLAGPVLELGLGNGRTYDHLRQLLPDREIIVFEREVRAHPDCIPDSRHLVLGSIEETLPMMVPRLDGKVALVHSDIGTGDSERNERLASWLATALLPLLRTDARIVADQPLHNARLIGQPLPEGVAADRYFVYRHRPT
jgi:hypothetical protein